jgi:hypothetical protein
MIKTFDACLALKPQRQDIIKYYMELTHPHILKLMGDYWDWRGIKLTPFETLNLIDWTYTYSKQLKLYGVRDDSLYNGFIVLCNAYATKIQSQLLPLCFTVLKQESSIVGQVEADFKGKVFTSFPTRLMKLFSEAFAVVRIKKIKELMLKMLKLYYDMTMAFQKALR